MSTAPALDEAARATPGSGMVADGAGDTGAGARPRPPSRTAPGRPGRRRLAGYLAFPAAATLGFVVLVGLGWNGSSSSLLRDHVEGPPAAEPGTRGLPEGELLVGAPNPTRSDEWAVITPLTVGQDANGYPQVNADAFGGTDVSVFSGLPYRDWSTLFRPQQWGFFVLPFEQGFAFSWWFPAWLLAVGCYGLVLGICPRRPGLATAAALTISFAPFVHWWFLTITTASLAWATVVTGLCIAFERLRHTAFERLTPAACLVAIAYATAAFLLVLYPAFQIPCAWVVVACVVGWALRAGASTDLRHRLAQLGWVGLAGAAGAAVFGLFLATRWEAVQLQAGTEYPGWRAIPTGHGDSVWLLSGFLDRYLTPGMALPGPLGTNPSEASSFVLTGLFLTIPAVWQVARGWLRQVGVDGLLVALLAVQALFLAFLFVPGLDLLAKVTLLSQVLPQRVYIGLGLASLLLTVAVVREMGRQQVRPRWSIVGLTAAVTLAALVRTGMKVQDLAPQWSGGLLRWLPLALAVTAIVALLARGHAVVALSMLAVFSLTATYGVNPVSAGVYDARSTALGEAIVEVDEADPGGWVALGPHLGSAVLAMLPVERYSGTALYPAFDMWAELDPTGEHRAVYNRYAHVAFTDDPDAAELAVPSPDQVVVRLEGCSPFARNRLRHVLSDRPVGDDCLTLNRTVTAGAKTYYIYDGTPTRASS